MNQQELWREIESLPPAARRELLDFISFLRMRYKPLCKSGKSNRIELANEPFVGIWLDRSEMEDSGKWVRNSREREWKRS